jgi:hypothetical protein
MLCFATALQWNMVPERKFVCDLALPSFHTPTHTHTKEKEKARLSMQAEWKRYNELCSCTLAVTLEHTAIRVVDAWQT